MIRSRPVIGAHQVDGVHRRLGAGVAEAPQRQPEPAGQLLGDDDRVLGRLGEVRALGDPALHRLDDRRVGVADDHHAVAAVQVDVLGAVDVPHPRAPPWLTHTVPDGRSSSSMSPRRPAPAPRDRARATARSAGEEHTLLLPIR